MQLFTRTVSTTTANVKTQLFTASGSGALREPRVLDLNSLKLVSGGAKASAPAALVTMGPRGGW